jgi:hypothetical protein
VDPQRLATERQVAAARGARPSSPSELAGARSHAPAAPLAVADMNELYREAARLILVHAPDERDRARLYLAPKP